MLNPLPLYNLNPLLDLLWLGALLALIPLGWLYWHQRRHTRWQKMQALRLLTLFLTFDLILFGAFTRLTDSGLGCPDWPGCYGNSSPIGAHLEIAAAQSAMPSGPVTLSKAWIEMLHRYLAMAVGALIVVMTLLSWRDWHFQRHAGPSPTAPAVHPGWATLTLVWVCLQGALGALTVTLKLFPAIVTLHLAAASVLLALLGWQVALGRVGSPALTLPGSTRRWTWLAAVLLGLQMLLGAWVSSNYAVLACNDFPTCQSQWWPTMDFQQGFSLWRPLGLNTNGEPITFAALTAIHYAHRLVAYLALGILAWLAWQLNHQTSAEHGGGILGPPRTRLGG